MVLGASPLAKNGVAASGRDVRLVPFYRFTIHSAKSKRETLAIVAGLVEKRYCPTDPLSYRMRYFGRVRENRFNLAGTIFNRRLFLPVIGGVVRDEGAGSRISVRMRLDVYGACLIAMCVISCFSVDAPAAHKAVLAGALFALLYAAAMTMFWSDALTQEDFFRDLLS
ncbi:MAG: hypothetical protein QM759_17510 [Terricaulis sp.]